MRYVIHVSNVTTIAFVISLVIVASLAGCNRAETGAVSKDVDAALSENAAFSALKQYDPAAYKTLANDFSTELAGGVPRAKIVDELAARGIAVAVKRLQMCIRDRRRSIWGRNCSAAMLWISSPRLFVR